MWPFKLEKKKHEPVELLEDRLKKKNILMDDEVLHLTVHNDGSYTVHISKKL